MDSAEARLNILVAGGSTTASAACSGTVRLYRLTNYGGAVLQLNTRNQLLSLASYGFDDDTSSYRVGPCGARFFDTATGGGVYPGATSAGSSSSTMASGWNNRISSILIL
ncbi:MAG: hypothetical protein JJE52_16740 [Acidimicrobiia bacterium]|nr:hypothetical protein [Acidimicrobiia bacterium]